MSSNAPNVLAQKQALMQGGSPELVEAQHSAGKLTARERIEKVLDEGTFIEVGVFLKSRPDVITGKDVPCEGVVAGFGTVNDRPVYIYAQDYTVLSGSVGHMHAEKICKVMDMAAENGVPVIGILDSAGARIGEGADALNAYGKLFKKSADLSGVVPQLTLVCGPCVGAAAIAASMSDVTFVVDEIVQLGAYGAATYDAKAGKADATGIVSASYSTATSGLAQLRYAKEDECFEALKSFLEYLPSNNLEDAPILLSADDLNRDIPSFDGYLGSTDYDVKDVVKAIADDNSTFELGTEYAKNMVTAFVRINERSIGVVANQPSVDGGSIDTKGAEKASDFIILCDAFNIPVLTLVDTQGVVACSDQEAAGIVKRCAKLATSYAQATVPMVSLVLNKAVGSSYSLMASKALGMDMVYAWPSAQIAVLPSEAAAMMLYDEEIKKNDDPAKARAEFTDKYRQINASPIHAAQGGYIDDIIDPINTRPIQAAAFEMLCGKRVEPIARKHGTL